MLDPSLRLLLRLRLRSLVRRLGRALWSVQGVVAIVFFACLFIGIMTQLIAGALVEREPIATEFIRRYVPIGMALLCTLQAFSTHLSRAMHFSPAEVNLLFPAPLGWRQLLLYKLVTVSSSSLATGVFISMFLAQHAHNGTFAMLAGGMTFLFLTCIGLSLRSMITQTRALYRHSAQIIALTPLTIVIIAAASNMHVYAEHGGLALAQAIADADPVRWVSAPFAVYVAAFTAEPMHVFLQELSLGVVLLLIPLGVLFHLPPAQLETVAAESERIAGEVQRARVRGSVIRNPQRAARLRVPPLPWWKGSGPMIHRQLTTMLRTGRSVLVVGGLIPAGTCLAVIFMAHTDGSGRLSYSLVPLLFVMVLFVIPVNLRYDFRGDIDQIGWIRSLPLGSWSLVIGQLAVPVLVNTVIVWLMLAAFALGDARHVAWGAPALLLAPPLVLLNIALDNATFLAYPTHNLGAGLSDIASMTRNFMATMLRMLGLVVAGSAALGVGLGSYAILRSLPVAVVLAALVLTAGAVAALQILRWSYKRFDVGHDMPV